LQATLSETLEIKVPGGTLITKSTLIALSTDSGETWYFIDTSNNSLEKIRTQLPNISENLVLSPPQEPIFYKD